VLAPALLGLILILALASLGIGPAPIPFSTAAKALFSGEGSAAIIVRDIRLPRTLLAILIGGTLGATGAALQGLLRNPLADSSVFGAPQARTRNPWLRRRCVSVSPGFSASRCPGMTGRGI